VTDADRPLKIERRIEARPEIVYAYLTESARWARWQGVSAEIEAVPGGTFRMTMANGFVAEGSFVELVPNRRVRFTWGWRGSEILPPGSSTVDIELVEDANETIVTLTHHGLPPQERTVHEIGWRHYVPRLVEAAQGRNPGPDPGPQPPPGEG
jgi:uncharacterized protein YndB with AHSA1/START domain